MKKAILAAGGFLSIAAAGLAFTPALADARYGEQPSGQGLMAQIHQTDAAQDQTQTQTQQRDRDRDGSCDQTQLQTRDRLHQSR